MKTWRHLALTLIAACSMSGCVYVPYYGYDPISPRPWLHPPEAYLEHDPYIPRRGDPAFRKRHYYREQELLAEERRGTASERSSEIPRVGEQPLPPAAVEPPAPEKSSQRPSTDSVPTATRGSKPGRVRVPFPPYNELDVSGMASGSLAKDPATGKVFRLP